MNKSTTYERFCQLRDQRRAGEEAPEYTEQKAFQIAVLELISTGGRPEWLAKQERAMKHEERARLVKKLVKRGDILTHEGCCGCISEHEFIRWTGNWMVGRPTHDTFRFEMREGRRGEFSHLADDIAPGNVTHINRVPVEAGEFLAKAAPASTASIDDTTYGN